MTHQDFNIILKEWWNTKFEGIMMYILVKKLDEVRNLKIWNRKIFKNVHYRKSIMKVRLEEIECEILNKGKMIDLDKE